MPPPAPDPHALVMFVSCVDGKPVTRLSPHGRSRSLIGAEREGRTIRYYPDRIVALTRAEVEAFGPVYERTIAEGGLKRRAKTEHDAAMKAHVEAKKKRAGEAPRKAAPAAGGDVS